MKCPACPVRAGLACLGEAHAPLCREVAAGRKDRIAQLVAIADPAIREAVNRCPDRGPVLPVSLQPSASCGCGELSECRAGRGKAPGRVTLGECLACKSD